MPQFVLLSYSIFKTHVGSVHRAGCRDIRRDAQEHGAHTETFAAPDAARVVAGWLDDEMREMGYDESAIKVHPCCGKAV